MYLQVVIFYIYNLIAYMSSVLSEVLLIDGAQFMIDLKLGKNQMVNYEVNH